MRRRLLRGVIVAVLAVALVVPVGRPAPASAAPATTAPAKATAVQGPEDILVIVNIAKGLLDLWRGFQGGGMSIEEATRQILAAIDRAKTDIISHMDQLAAAEARSCATRHVIELADIERFSPDTLQAWAQNATACVTLIDSLLGVVVDKPATDTLGGALDVVGPIALIARSRAGFSTSGLLAILTSANNKIITKLVPECVFQSGFQPPYVTRSVCIAYNGDRAECACYLRFDPVGTDALREQAAWRTTWVLARYALPRLQG